MRKKLISGILISAMAALLFSAPAIASEVKTENATAEEDEINQDAGKTAEGDVFTEEISEEGVPAGDISEDDQSEPDFSDGYNPENDVTVDDSFAETIDIENEPDIDGSSDEGKEPEEDEDPVYAILEYDVQQTPDMEHYTGFYQDLDSGDWYYYTDGKIDTGMNSVIKDANGAIGSTSEWYYVVGGKVQMDFTGLANYSNASGWWYITNGRVNRSVTTVAKNKNGWYYVKNGKVDRSYTGFATNENGSWYMESGRLTRKVNCVVKDTNGAIGSTSEWYYVVGSKVRYDFTGLANYKNSSGWWYITKGKVDRGVNTVAKNKNGWYYVKNGKVDKSYTGFATNENGSWYMESGKLTRKVNSVVKDTHGALGSTSEWYYVVGSKVRYDFTGLANYKNSSGWWYITKGKVDRSVNTVDKNNNGWYYVDKGKVDYSYTGIAKNSNGWWHIKGGRLDSSAGDYSFAEKTSQIIDVQTSGSTGTLTLYNKSGNHFTKAFSSSCYVGRNGISSNKSEGDGKAPSGVYTLGQAFGVASNPGCTRSYLKLNSNYYWVDDSTSKYYNQLVDISKVSKDWSSAEHLIDYTNSYKYAISIDYNTACTPYKGSAVFLHCSTGSTTSGCVAVSESYMIKILQSLTSDTRIYIH